MEEINETIQSISLLSIWLYYKIFVFIL